MVRNTINLYKQEENEIGVIDTPENNSYDDENRCNYLSKLSEIKQVKKKEGIKKIKQLKEELNGENVYRDDGQPNYHRIPKEDARRAAEEYGEGCESLTNFLEACIENNIITTASCAGHPERGKNYSCVTFDASNENTKQLIEFISETKLPYEISMWKLNKSRFGESGEAVTVTIYVDLDKRDLLYNTCTEKIKKGINETKKKEKQSKSLMRSLIGLIEEYELKMEFGGSITYDVQEEQLHFNEEALKRKYIKIIDDIPNGLDYIL